MVAQAFAALFSPRSSEPRLPNIISDTRWSKELCLTKLRYGNLDLVLVMRLHPRGHIHNLGKSLVPR